MNNHVRKLKRNPCRTEITMLCLIVLLSATPAHGIVPVGAEAGILQFDGIVELNAPHFQTHVLLFVRYWVSPEFYDVAVTWAEPHVGSLNFPLYPITTVIESNERSFSLTNDVHSMYNSVFSKPIGRRGVFRYMFNDYPIPNIRFAESDALASRIYTNDLAKLASQTEDDWQTIDIANSTNEKGIDREVAKVNLRVTDGRIDALKLMDAKAQLIKSIEYEYSAQKQGPLLSKQKVVLAERPLSLGFRGDGIKMTVDGKEQTYRELPGSHHKGTRTCSVDYEPTKMGDKSIALPVRVVVRAPDGQTVLRSARLFNFKQLELNPEQARKPADGLAHFDSSERKCREMLLKYWQKDPAEVQDEDLKILRQLQTHFEEVPIVGKTAGEQLRRINMLLELDWMLGERDRLQEHFEQYLAILTANNLNRMVLVGGLHVIDTTIRWRQFAVADHLLQTWVETAIAVNNAEAILNFGQSVIRKSRSWMIAGLIEKSLASSNKWGKKRFNAEALKCMAIHKLYEMLQNPERNKIGIGIAQARLVSSSKTIDELLTTLTESITQAQNTFANLAEPTPKQKALKAQLDKISQKIAKAQN